MCCTLSELLSTGICMLLFMVPCIKHVSCNVGSLHMHVSDLSVPCEEVP